MSKRYDELMEHIDVTPEMRRRILSHIKQVDMTKDTAEKMVRFSHIRKFAALAACLAVVLVGVLTLPSLFYVPDNPDVIAPGDGIVQVSSVDELAEQVGFEVAGLDCLPFVADEVTYTAYWQDLAEITYSGDGQTAIYRKGTGSEDVSGDYGTYEDKTEVMADNVSVTLKGNNGSYSLATWTDGNYGYSIALSHGMDEDSWYALLKR